MSACPTPEQLESFLDGTLAAADHKTAETHIEHCDRCMELLEFLSVAENGLDTKLFGDAPPAALSEWVARAVEQLQLSPLEFSDASDTVSTGELRRILFPSPPTPQGPLGRIGTYHVRRELGTGRFGSVFEAWDESIDRMVALKILVPAPAVKSPGRKDLVFEARQAARVKHDHVVTVHQVVAESEIGLPYLVMESIDGESLAERLKKSGTLEPREAARVTREVARGLAAAHDKRLIHRDIKPSNIMLEEKSGRAKIADFGLARLLSDSVDGAIQSDRVVGTPAYMSPEQVTAPATLDERTDIYSLGVVFYEMLTGERPFHGATPNVLRQLVQDDPRPPRKLNDHIPRDLETICLKCLQKEPGKRYASASVLADDLERWLEGKPIQARPVGWAEATWRWCRRKPAVAGLAATVALTLVSGMAVSTYFAWQEKKRAEEATDARRATDKERYVSDMRLVQRAWEENRGDLVVELLERQVLERTGGVDLRGFEWHYWWRRCHAELAVFSGHGGSVQAVAVSPDSKTVATASFDRTARVWDATTGQELLRLPHPERVAAVAFAPDGRRLATGAFDQTARIWDTATGQLLVVMGPRLGWIYGLAFSNDGRRLAVGNDFGKARFLDAQTGHELLALQHSGRVSSLAFSPDGRFHATAGDDGAARLWDADTGRELRAFRGHTDERIFCVAFSPDSQRLATASRDHTARVWDLATGQEIIVLRHDNHVGSVAFSPDGQTLATGCNDQTARVWDATTGKLLALLKGHTNWILSVAFSPDSRYLATASEDGTARLWDTQPPRDPLVLEGHTRAVTAVAFSADGRFLASGSGDQTARLWDAATGRELRVLNGHTDRLTGVAFGPGGRYFVSSSHDRTARIWETATGQALCVLHGHTCQVTSVAFSPDNQYVATASGRYATDLSDQTVRIWDAASGRQLRVLEGHTDWVTSVAFSPDGHRLASASRDFTVRIWDVETGRALHVMRGPPCWVNGVAFGPDGRLLATTSEDGTARIWDAATGVELRVLRGHTHIATAVAFSPDSRRLTTASHDCTVRLWDVATGQELLVLKGHQKPVLSVAFSPDGHRLATASQDATVLIWETEYQSPEGRRARFAGRLKSVVWP